MTDVIILLLDNSVIWLNAQSLTETEYANTKMQLKAISGHVQMIFDVKILTIMRQNEAKKCSEEFGIRSFHLEYEAKGSLINDNHTGVICNDKGAKTNRCQSLYDICEFVALLRWMEINQLAICRNCSWIALNRNGIGIQMDVCALCRFNFKITHMHVWPTNLNI